jgi:hypothetical protein
MPAFENAMASEGSTGVTVLPVASQWAMWAAITRWTRTRTAVRRRPDFEGRIAGAAAGVWSTGSGGRRGTATAEA